jgi:peroxiredoxin (alkyl hydroperoxide reductase subunit C)
MSYVGKPAPPFANLAGARSLPARDERVSLSDYAGRWLVLFFYPADGPGESASELQAFSARIDTFAALEADVVAVSTDGIHVHEAFLRFALGELRFPLASDPTLAVSRDFGVLNEEEGVAERAVFIVDPQGVVCYEVHPRMAGVSVEEVARVLEAMVTYGRAADRGADLRVLAAGDDGLEARAA